MMKIGTIYRHLELINSHRTKRGQEPIIGDLEVGVWVEKNPDKYDLLGRNYLLLTEILDGENCSALRGISHFRDIRTYSKVVDHIFQQVISLNEQGYKIFYRVPDLRLVPLGNCI